MKKIKILSNNDLDGAGSLMLMKWVFKDVAEIDYSITNLFKLKRDYEQIDVDDYSKIFILNMIPDFEVEDNVLVFSKAEFKLEPDAKLCSSTGPIFSHVNDTPITLPSVVI